MFIGLTGSVGRVEPGPEGVEDGRSQESDAGVVGGTDDEAHEDVRSQLGRDPSLENVFEDVKQPAAENWEELLLYRHFKDLQKRIKALVL